MTALISFGFIGSSRANRLRRAGLTALLSGVVAILILSASPEAYARPVTKGKGGSGGVQPQTFLRQLNVFSNMEFYYTNRGVLFYAGNGQNEGLFWPRGSGNSYIFGEGLWFATQKQIQGKRHKLCELGYNPNSGAGWYIEGEASQVGLSSGTDGANPAAKYISYVGPRYDKSSGAYVSGSSTVVPSPYYGWPLWDTAVGKTLNHNFYFGDYISDVGQRNVNKLLAANSKPNPVPAITSEEDILNFYTDQDPTDNPEYRPGTGYPFGLDIQEEIYSWSFGRYRDMIFLRHKVTNSSSDSLLNCWMAPAFDPDLDAAAGGAGNDGNSYVNDSLVKADADPADIAQLREPYRSDPTKLNMGVQWRNYTTPPNGKQYGWIGFSFLESPVIDARGNIVANDDSVSLGGYGYDSLFQKNQLGLVTFQDWIILNDPSTEDLRYNFVSAGSKALFNGVYQDQRLLMATGPFTLPPKKSVETVVGITIAQVDNSDYHKNFGALLLLTDFAHLVFGEVDSTPIAFGTDTNGKADTTFGYSVNHFVSPAPPSIPKLTTTALDKAVLVQWDTTADRSVHNLQVAPALAKDTALAFLGYQLWRSSRSDHDSTIRPDGTNPDVMLGDWHLYDFKTDSVFDSKGHLNHFHYTRTNTTPHPIPHSYLDVGDDNHDGILTGSEGLLDNVTYYYYLIAYNEYDSINQVGPLYTAIVPPKNFVPGIPNKPVFLAPFAGDSTSDVNSCLAGSGKIGKNFGGVQDVRLTIVDTGIFAKLFTDDTINVSFQPRWTEFIAVNQSPLYFYVDVTDNKNGIQNTYRNLNNPSANTAAYSFPTSLPGTIVYHVDGPTSAGVVYVFGAHFTTDNGAFAPNQTIDQAFKVLADVNLEQLSTPYRLSSVSVSGAGDPNILRLSRRTNNGSDGYANQSIYNLPTDSMLGVTNNLGATRPTRPSFLGGLGETSYDITFGNVQNPGPFPIAVNGDTIFPRVMPITVSLTNCTQSVLQPVPATTVDTANDMTTELDYHFYSATVTATNGQTIPAYTDPDTMHVPNPGWYQMAAFHYTDGADFNSQHTGAALAGQGINQLGTVGPYYFPMGGSDNIDNSSGTPVYHLVVHKLSVGGAEIIFNAPEVPSAESGDTLPGTGDPHNNPHATDFAPGDKVTLSFTGMMKNLPFPGAKFTIKTESGSPVNFSNANNYVDSILAQVQVVPNPYIVSHLGQTSTDNAKLFFTRLPPRCTIEIYALDGTLVNTIEHNGYQPANPSNPLTDQSSVETWNLLTSGQQRVGSQVLFARVVAKDPNSGSEIGEVTTKFAVVVGLSK